MQYKDRKEKFLKMSGGKDSNYVPTCMRVYVCFFWKRKPEREGAR